MAACLSNNMLCDPLPQATHLVHMPAATLHSSCVWWLTLCADPGLNFKVAEATGPSSRPAFPAAAVTRGCLAAVCCSVCK